MFMNPVDVRVYQFFASVLDLLIKIHFYDLYLHKQYFLYKKELTLLPALCP